MAVGEDSGSVAADGAFVADLLQRGVEFFTSFDELKVAAKFLANAHSFEVPVRHFAEEDDGTNTTGIRSGKDPTDSAV